MTKRVTYLALLLASLLACKDDNLLSTPATDAKLKGKVKSMAIKSAEENHGFDCIVTQTRGLQIHYSKGRRL